MSKEVLVSIIMPSLNCAQYLEETILSVRMQNYSNIEHIVVDGGSTDGSVDILEKYDGQIIMKKKLIYHWPLKGGVYFYLTTSYSILS